MKMQMRRQDVRVHEGVWLYRPGRWLTLTPATCTVIQALPEVGPWVFPLSWRQVEFPWSNRAVEKSWERFRRTLPGTLAHLTLTGLRASREQWVKHEEAEADPGQKRGDVPFHIRAPLPDLSALIEQLQQAGSGEEAGLTVKDLADCFRRILDSCPVDAALNLKKPRHREPDVATTERNEMIALDMGLEIQNGASYTDTSTIVAENWKKHSSFKNIPVLRVRETVKNDPHCHLKVMTIRRFKYPSRK